MELYIGKCKKSFNVQSTAHSIALPAAFEEFDGGNRTVLGPTGTGGVFATYPQPYYGVWMGAAEQVYDWGYVTGPFRTSSQGSKRRMC